MAEKKTDRRALKTQKALKNGLVELLTEKELRNITVQEISDRVDIHRVTFYKHSEKNSVDLKDSRMDYLSVYWASGCVAILERWVQKDFSESKDYIIKTLSQLDEHMEKYIADHVG